MLVKYVLYVVLVDFPHFLRVCKSRCTRCCVAGF